MGEKKKKTSRTKRDKSRDKAFFLFTAPGFILYSFFFITPVLMGVYYSVTDWDGISKKYDFIGFDNYVKIFRTSQFMNSLFFTL